MQKNSSKTNNMVTKTILLQDCLLNHIASKKRQFWMLIDVFLIIIL